MLCPALRTMFVEGRVMSSQYHPPKYEIEELTVSGPLPAGQHRKSQTKRVLRTYVSPFCKLARHGARFPTSTIGTIAKTGLAKIQNVTKFTDSRLNFIKSFVYDLGTNNLVLFGAKQWVRSTHCDHVNLIYGLRCFDLGAESFQRYSSLFSASNIPFVRSDSSDRVVKSAMNWTAGTTRSFSDATFGAD